MKKNKYVLYIDKNTFNFNSIVDCVYEAYCYDDFTIVCNDFTRFDFHISDFNVSKTPCVYDSFYMAFVSVFLTRSERDKLIKKLRGEK